MAAETHLPVTERLSRLFQHLAIPRAHVAGGGSDIADWASTAPHRVASATFICPPKFTGEPLRPLAARLLAFHGDHGPGALNVPRAFAGLPGARTVVLKDYADTLWCDPVAERLSEVGPTMLTFLADISQDDPIERLDGADDQGEVAGITYRAQGSGPPLMLFPVNLAASQWEPLLPALNQHFRTITLGGLHLWPVSLLEQRARAGLGAVVRTLVDALALRAGERILDVGCGSGAYARWLARRTEGANPIVGVDVNRYLLREATALAAAEGMVEQIRFQEGDAEALPFPADSFDVTLACTLIEEGDADRMLAELVRVTKPGGRVGVIVRATDMPEWNNLVLPPEMKVKANATGGAGASAAGCADASLYRRICATGLSELKMGPQLGTSYADPSLDRVRSGFEARQLSVLSTDEAEVWRAAVARAAAEGTYLWAQPFHCAVGTKR